MVPISLNFYQHRENIIPTMVLFDTKYFLGDLFCIFVKQNINYLRFEMKYQLRKKVIRHLRLDKQILVKAREVL